MQLTLSIGIWAAVLLVAQPTWGADGSRGSGARRRDELEAARAAAAAATENRQRLSRMPAQRGVAGLGFDLFGTGYAAGHSEYDEDDASTDGGGGSSLFGSSQPDTHSPQFSARSTGQNRWTRVFVSPGGETSTTADSTWSGASGGFEWSPQLPEDYSKRRGKSVDAAALQPVILSSSEQQHQQHQPQQQEEEQNESNESRPARRRAEAENPGGADEQGYGTREAPFRAETLQNWMGFSRKRKDEAPHGRR